MMLRDLMPAPGTALDWAAVTDAFDWVRAMRGSTQDARHHAEGDVWVHTRMVTEELLALPGFAAESEENRLTLFATALLHDVAKPVTRREEEGRITNRGHSRIGAVMARGILWRMGVPLRLRERICTLIAFHQIPFWLLERPEWQARRTLTEVSLTVENRLLALFAEADARGRVAPDRQRIIDNAMLYAEMADELGCRDAPFPFASDFARVRYFRDAETRHPGDAPFDTLDPGFTVTLMSGLPGTGKSTRAAALSQPVIALDAVRREMGVDADDEQGGVVQEARERARVLLRAKQGFVWDGTNLSRELRGLTLPLLLDYGARVRILYLEAPAGAAAQRNRERGRDAVPDAAIERMLRRWEVPTPAEAHEVAIEAA